MRPYRLPRGFSSIIVAVVYHPHWSQSENSSMCDHLFRSISLAESRYPNCAFIIAGDFNRLDVNSLKKHFRLKQIVKKPTRKDAILDLILTNLYEVYDNPKTFPAFGLSDHNTITAQPKNRQNERTIKFVFKRDKRESRKAVLGRYLCNIDWPGLFSTDGSCEDLLKSFSQIIHTGLDLLMPLKRVRVSTNDAPWMTQHLRSLIMKRQKAFHEKGSSSPLFRFYRNLVNRERKICKFNFYKFKVENMKEENPKVWWKEVKRLCGSYKQPTDIISVIHDNKFQDLSPVNLEHEINKAFLEPQQEYHLSVPLARLPTDDHSLELPDTSELRIHRLLSKLNPSKACGPDDIPNWLLREYSDILALPVSKIITSSFNEQCVLSQWKFANVTPLPKTKQVANI